MSIENLRKPKIFGLAIFDLVTSLIGTVAVFLLAWKWHFPTLNPWIFILAGLLLAIPIGIVFHVIFGTNTALNNRLGLSYKP